MKRNGRCSDDCGSVGNFSQGGACRCRCNAITSLPHLVAQFQSISALTGTGFTTHEAEMIVNYPIRRKILVALMIVGNLGLVSLASSFIVTFVDTGRTSVDATLVQLVTIVAAAGVVFIFTTNKALNRSMCKLVGAMLTKEPRHWAKDDICRCCSLMMATA